MKPIHISNSEKCETCFYWNDAGFEKDEKPIGDYIRVKGVYFQVVGVFEPMSGMNFGGEKEQTIILPFTSLQKAYNFGNQVHYF